MGCERPFTIRNPKGGYLQAICGTCRGCLLQDIADWSERLKNELKHCFNAYFVTLTYSDEYLPNEVKKIDFQEFIKKMRNKASYKDLRLINLMGEDYIPIRYFGCGEYGEKYKRPHYHIIIFNIPIFANGVKHKPNHNTQVRQVIEECWNKGFVSIDVVNDGTIHYTCKYIFKQKNHKEKDLARPFRLMSTRPALGYKYIEEMKEYHWTGKYFLNKEGYKVHLPRYYANKIFDDNMKEERKELFEREALKRDELKMLNSAMVNIVTADLERQSRELKTEIFNKKFKKSKL